MRRDQTAGRQHGDAEWEAMADDVFWAKHHLQFPTVGQIQQIFLCSRLVFVSIFKKKKNEVLWLADRGETFTQTVHVWMLSLCCKFTGEFYVLTRITRLY